ncbi:MAG: Condensation domain protein [Phycisphaerales bacterium]|nr:Condensation domain protein [Phycisphaerales bacterium]
MCAAALNVFQRLVRTWDAVYPYNAAQVLKLRGRADASAVNTAWQRAMAGMGLGSVRVVGVEAHFTQLNGQADRFSVRVLPAGTSLEDVLTEGLNRPFDDPEEPPFRPFLIQESDSFYFGVVYQHWVADSVSIRLLLREWCLRLQDVTHAPMDAVRHPSDGYWKLFGSRHGELRIDQAALGVFRSHMRFRRVLKVQTAGKDDYPVRVMLHALPDGAIDALRLNARAQGVTVGDVLLAAIAEACQRHLPVQRRPRRRDLAVGNIVDLRPHARGHLDETFGLFLGFAHVFCTPSDLRDWPRLLKSVANQNRTHARRGVAQSSAAWMLAASTVQKLVPNDKLYHFYRKEIPLAAGLSNVNLNGTWVDTVHPDPLLEYLRISPTGPMAPLAFSTTTLGSRLQIAMTYRQALLTNQAAEEMAKCVIDRLKSVAGVSCQLPVVSCQ